MKYFQVTVPQGDGEKKKEYIFKELLMNLQNTVKDVPISLEILGFEQYSYFFIAVPDNLFNTVESLLYSAYPNCEIQQNKDYIESTLEGKSIAGCRLTLATDDVYPIKTYEEFQDDSLSRLFSVISKIATGERVWVQLVIVPRNENAAYHVGRRFKFFKSRIKKVFNVRDIVRGKGGASIRKERKGLATEKISGTPFTCSFRLAYLASDTATARNKLTAVVNSFFQFNKTDVQDFKVRFLSKQQFLSEYKRRKLVSVFHLTPDEIATMYHLPNADLMPHIVHVLAKKSEAPQDVPKPPQANVSFFGKTNYHNNCDTFGVSREDRRRHLYAVGKSGSGKSKMLELLIKADIDAGKGVGILDPHGDLVDNVMKYVPKERLKDVIYFDPSDIDFPISFNPLEGVDEAYKMQVTIGFLEIFKKLFGSNWTDRLEHVLRYTVLALLDSPNTTVLSILKMLTDKNYRQTIVARIQDNVVKNFWVSEFAGWSQKFDAEAITPLLNKVGQFVATNMIRNIVGQPENKLNIREIMDGEKILLMKVSKGLLGQENSSLLGSMIITKLYQAAMSRAEIPEEERKDFYFYVDEFQNFATDTFAEILAEARKYRLNLTIAHQYMGQLSEVVRKTVFGNVGSMISFRVGADDAALLEEEYNPIFTKRDIINLGVREFYCKMSVNGEIREAFSGRTLDVPKVGKTFVNEIIDHSRKNYCKPKKEVVDMLSRWDEAGEFDLAPEESPVFEEPLI